MRIAIKNFKGKQIGEYDTEDATYYRIINKRQIFINPKYQGMMAVSENVLRKLASLGCRRFCFTVTEWEEETFDAIISFKDFIEKKERIDFRGKLNSDVQYGVRLFHWSRRPRGQMILR